MACPRNIALYGRIFDEIACTRLSFSHSPYIHQLSGDYDLVLFTVGLVDLFLGGH
jgi:hypothetical protein